MNGMPETPFRLPHVAPLCRSSRGAITPIFTWRHYGDPQMAPYARSLTYFHNASIDEVKTCLDKGVGAKTPYHSGVTPLHRAAMYSRNPEVIAALIDAGADVEARGQSENTPLHAAAAQSGSATVVEALIEAGANLAARNEDGFTPLDQAVRMNDNPEIARVLRDAGAPTAKTEKVTENESKQKAE